MTILTYTLPKVSFEVVEPHHWGEEFSNLQDIYIDGPITFIVCRGNVYEVRVRSYYGIWESYCDKKCEISIHDEISGSLVGRGTCSTSHLNGTAQLETTLEIRKAIEKAIIRVNVKPTDYYK